MTSVRLMIEQSWSLYVHTKNKTLRWNNMIRIYFKITESGNVKWIWI